MKTVYLSLGSNLGNRAEQLELALVGLDKAGLSVISRSSVYETEPQDVLDQPWFLNLVVACETKLFPMQLLKRLQRIESDLGRSRGRSAQPRGPRTVDIDILLFGNAVIDAPELTVPHPRMTVRRFVLEPLAEIAPDLRDPVTRKPFTEFLAKLNGQKIVKLEHLST